MQSARPFGLLLNPSNPQSFLMSPTLPAGIVIDHYNNEPLRLGIMASGAGSNFEAIAQAIEDKTLNAQIAVLVCNNLTAGVLSRSDRWGIPSVLLDHRQFKSREDLDRAILSTMASYQVNWVIMAGWMRCVTTVLIDAFPQRILNIHPSLLPSFPGLHAVKQALDTGVMITGCTVHYVVPKVDSGRIIMQAAVAVLPHDTEKTLHERINIQEHIIYPQAIILAASAS